jgi:hypothetical protein
MAADKQHVEVENIESQPDISQTGEVLKQDAAWQVFKDNPKIILYSIASCMSALLWGYDIGTSAITIALPGFKLVFGYEYEGE